MKNILITCNLLNSVLDNCTLIERSLYVECIIIQYLILCDELTS